MAQNSKFTALPGSKKDVEVTLTPIDGKIQYRIAGKIFNNSTNEFETGLAILDADDEVWNLVFGGQRGTKRFLKAKKKVRKVLPLATFGFENCEVKN